ncbi:MAG: flagellar protein FliT [Gammaproteobacteria bacterium]|nr:flagellar protein FliT [Gammaproteobacteria bacterium]MDH3768328.1 flagellar protein FliT [Gammaproteobacteria bacterium]
MHDDGAASGNSNVFEEIIQLCTRIGEAVREADWDTAGALLSRRHRLLESAFDKPPATDAQAASLMTIAQQVSAFDRELMPVADTARGEAATELKRLRRARLAANTYKQNAT